MSGDEDETLISDHPPARPAARRRQECPIPGEPLWLDEPKVKEVMDTATGRHLTPSDVIGTDYPRVVRLRKEIKDAQRRGEPLYTCSICQVPLHLVRSALNSQTHACRQARRFPR